LLAPGGFVGAADENRFRVLADELDPFELADDRVHRQREDSATGERLGSRSRRRLQLLVVELDPHRTQLFGQGRSALRRVVRDEADPVPVGTKPPDGVAPAGDRFARDVEDSVDVKQNCSHGRRVYSCDPFGRSAAH